MSMKRKERTAHVFALTQEDADTRAESRGQSVIRARVFRAATRTWEDLGVIYRGEAKEVKHGDGVDASR